MKLLRKIAELEIQLVCRECLKRDWSGQWFFTQYCIHLLRKPVHEDRRAALLWMANFGSSMNLLLIKWHEQE